MPRRAVLMTTFACLELVLIRGALSEENVTEPTRQEWQAQIDQARERVEQIRREGRFLDEQEPSVLDIEAETAKRALDDEELRPGDVVSTAKGFVRFEGVSAENKRIFTPVMTSPKSRK